MVAVSDYQNRTMLSDEAVAYHEGIPGHHMQLSVQRTLAGLPEFRKHGGNSGYTEGWALYAEQLGKEVGFYQDPGSDYGRLRSEAGVIGAHERVVCVLTGHVLKDVGAIVPAPNQMVEIDADLKAVEKALSPSS